MGLIHREFNRGEDEAFAHSPHIKEKMMKREQPRLKKLTLNRETIVMLSEAELAKAQGGQMNTGDTYGCGNSAGCTGVFCG
jgi:hypothetical protein